VQNLENRAAAERGTPREHLEEDGARSEQVGACVYGIPGHLFRGHVARRAHHDTGACQSSRDVERATELRPREPEIQQLHAMHGQEDVGWLQVAMHDAAGVQRREGGQDAERDRHRLRRAEGARPETLRQRFALQELHRDEQAPPVFPDLVDLADVRVIDAGRGPCLAPEALPRRGVVGWRGQRLDGNRAFEPIVTRGVHDAHTAFAQLALDCIPANARGPDLAGTTAVGVRRGTGRCRSGQPFVEASETRLRGVVRLLVGHGRVDHTSQAGVRIWPRR
jgi:hypothetical protein